MNVKGRDKPTVQLSYLDDGSITFRVEFDLRPDAWAEFNLSRTELLVLANSERPGEESHE